MTVFLPFLGILLGAIAGMGRALVRLRRVTRQMIHDETRRQLYDMRLNWNEPSACAYIESDHEPPSENPGEVARSPRGGLVIFGFRHRR